MPPNAVPVAGPQDSWRLQAMAVHALDCGAMRTAAIHDPESIRKVLVAVGPLAEVPGFLPVRSPPRQREMGFAE